MDYWQVIRTNRRGKISGTNHIDPREAISQFIWDSKKGGCIDIFFRRAGQLVLTMPSNQINYVYLEKLNTGGWDVSFSCENLEQAREALKRREIPCDYNGVYYQHTIVIDFRTNQRVLELHQEAGGTSV